MAGSRLRHSSWGWVVLPPTLQTSRSSWLSGLHSHKCKIFSTKRLPGCSVSYPAPSNCGVVPAHLVWAAGTALAGRGRPVCPASLPHTHTHSPPPCCLRHATQLLQTCIMYFSQLAWYICLFFIFKTCFLDKFINILAGALSPCKSLSPIHMPTLPARLHSCYSTYGSHVGAPVLYVCFSPLLSLSLTPTPPPPRLPFSLPSGGDVQFPHLFHCVCLLEPLHLLSSRR